MEKSCIWNFKPIIKERKLPKSWEEFCEMFPTKPGEYYLNSISQIERRTSGRNRIEGDDRNLLPNRAIAEAVRALCQLIQLRNAYNGDWVPDWTDDSNIFMLEFTFGKLHFDLWRHVTASPLYFKTEELCYEFLNNFRDLIEKLKPLYDIK